MSDYKSDFLRVLSERGYIHQISDVAGLDQLAAKQARGRLCGLRLHRAVAAHRAPDLDHDAALAAADRQQADRADGRRHDARRRSVRARRDAQDPHLRADRRQQGVDQGHVLEVHHLRRGQERRRHGGQCRMADQAQLHRDAARRRPAFLDQPHADDGLGEAAARPRAGALVHRVQLHDPAVLRLRRARASATAAICRWAARTSGATSSTASISAGAWARISSTR